MSNLSELSGFGFLLLALLTAHARASHKGWWSCNSECARCMRMVMSMEDLIVQFYPGLFSLVPPGNVNLSREAASNVNSTIDSGTAEIPEVGHPDAGSGNISRNSFNTAVWDFNTNRRPSHQSVSPGCCETEIEYATPTSFNIRGQVYQVVHLQNAFQFIPFGKCKEGSTCTQGECKEQYRAHWVLIYNATKLVTGPPVSFSAIEVPSHCECINLGRSTQ